jgi:hypothetical protein
MINGMNTSQSVMLCNKADRKYKVKPIDDICIYHQQADHQTSQHFRPINT